MLQPLTIVSHTMDNHDKRVRALLKAPGNLECADCGDSGKAVVKFCSVKLGVFLCNQCYAAHRALGAHVTRGKCIGLDSFNDSEVDLLSRLGNTRVNSQYEATMPANAKPPLTPCNGCSLSTCGDCKQRLRFVADKYDKKLWYSDTPHQSFQVPQETGATIGGDPFGLYDSSTPSQSTQQQAQHKANDADFFSSFGL